MSTWTGWTTSAVSIARQIEERWGKKEACEYEPRDNCLTFVAWKKKGYVVKLNEKPLTLRLKNRIVKLYYKLQVKKESI